MQSGLATAAALVEARTVIAQNRRLLDEMRVLRAAVTEQTHYLHQSAAALKATIALGLSAPRVPPADARARALDPKDAARLDQLTAREIEVLRMVGEGLRTKEIAFQLGITFKTAVTHRSNIMEKLGIHEGPRLVRFAIRTGICNA